jgi:hypothetical protein
VIDERRWAQRWILGAVAASVVLRLPYLRRPLSVDEAGALVVARGWDRGRGLYVDLFIDRPQGVIAAFQRWDHWFGPSTTAVRLLAVLAGVLVVLGCAGAARAASGRWAAGAVAAWLAAVFTSSPAIEGFAANGELLAGAATVPAAALGALVAVRRLPPPWLVLAGALAATGMTIKQSGFDVLAAIGAWTLVAAWRGWRRPTESAALLGWLALGAGPVLVATLAHGASLGWDAYAYAQYGFRTGARSALAGAQLGRMGLTALVALPIFGPALYLAVRRVRSLPGPLATRIGPGHALVLAWAATATAGFLAGGNYHRHYWVQLAFPVATAAAIGLTAGPAPTRRQVLRTTAAALVLPVAVSLLLIARPSLERDPRVDADVAIAAWFREHRASPDDDLLPLCASVTWYLEAGQQPRVPYLWVDHVRFGRGAVPELVALLDGADRPTYLALHQPVSRCDPSGQLQAVIDRRYRAEATVDGVEVLIDAERS